MSQPQVRPSPDGDQGQTAVAPPSTRRGDLDLLRAWPDAELAVIDDSRHTGSDTVRERVRSALDTFVRR